MKRLKYEIYTLRIISLLSRMISYLCCCLFFFGIDVICDVQALIDVLGMSRPGVSR